MLPAFKAGCKQAFGSRSAQAACWDWTIPKDRNTVAFMQRDGLPHSKPDVAGRFVIAALCVLALFLLGRTALKRWQERESVRVQKQREWIQNAVEELGKAGPPPDDLGQPPPYYPWITKDYLIFSNGWAAYKIHTAHSSRAIGDIALLRLSDGRFYSSGLHYCTGITSEMRDRSRERAPADAQEFLTDLQKPTHGICFRRMGECSVRSFVRTLTTRGNMKKSYGFLFTLPLTVAKQIYLKADMCFLENFCLGRRVGFQMTTSSIEILNRDWPPGYYPNTPLASLAILKFQRDQQTGRFTDQKR